jgi:hypothetical protein
MQSVAWRGSDGRWQKPVRATRRVGRRRFETRFFLTAEQRTTRFFGADCGRTSELRYFLDRLSVTDSSVASEIEPFVPRYSVNMSYLKALS